MLLQIFQKNHVITILSIHNFCFLMLAEYKESSLSFYIIGRFHSNLLVSVETLPKDGVFLPVWIRKKVLAVWYGQKVVCSIGQGKGLGQYWAPTQGSVQCSGLCFFLLRV